MYTIVLFSMYPFSVILFQLGLQYSSSVERMSTQQKQQLAFKCLREVVRYRSDELDMYLCILSTVVKCTYLSVLNVPIYPFVIISVYRVS